MAGHDTEFDGQAQLAPGATVGLLEQEPAARSRQGRAGQHRGGGGRGAGAARPLQRALDELLRGDRRRAGRRAGADRRRRRLEPRDDARDRHGRAALPAARRRRLDPLRRRAPPGRAVPAAPAPARPAAPRRADQPPRRRVGGLARAPPARLRRDGGRGHPRPLLPGQRGRLDPRARPRPRHPLPGQLLGLARAEARPARAGGAPGGGAQADDRPRARVGAAERQRAAQQAQGAAERLRGAAGPGGRGQARQRADPHPGRPAAGRGGGRGRGPAQGLRRPRPVRGPVLQPAPRAGSSA